MNLRNLLVLTAALIIGQTDAAEAQTFGTQTTYDEELKKVRQISPLGDNLFGERINLQDGIVSFSQTDVSITSKSGLKLEFGRISESRTTINAFAPGWAMNVPYMVGTYDTRSGWNTAGAGTSRCSTGKFAPAPEYLQYVAEDLRVQPAIRNVSTSNIVSPAHVFWHGIEINIPFVGNEQLLELRPGLQLPSDGKTYVGATKTGWRIRCLPSISNGQGEGFAVLLDDGTTYYFDRMMTIDVRDYVEWTNSTGMFSNPRYSYQLPLSNYFLLATKRIDRHGNVITYQYDDQHPSRLLAIHAEDGTRLDFYYTSDSPGSITEIRSGPRKWTYSYLQSVPTPEIPTRINLALQSITLPDGSSWRFEDSYHFSTFGDPWDVFESWKATISNFWEYNAAQNCRNNIHKLGQAIMPVPQGSYVVSMIHPSGAKGEFTFQHQFHGINNAPGSCHGSISTSASVYTLGVPDVYLAKSLTRKKISGPGLQNDLTWTYSYNPSWSFARACEQFPGQCNDRSITTISSPDNSIEIIEIGNDYASNFGRELSRKTEKNGQLQQRTTYEYLTSAVGQSFPEYTGSVPLGTGVADMYGNQNQYANRPLIRTTYYRDGATYVNETAPCEGGILCFNNFALATKNRRTNTLGSIRTDDIQYHNDLALWVIGLPGKITNIESGITLSEITYDSQALPWHIYKHGKLQQTLTYNSNGSLASITDGRGNQTTLSNWKRDIPQLITHPGGLTQHATVNDNGWITSVTDENGFVTGYGYDAMGRLASVVQPMGDTLAGGATAYHSTWSHFGPVLEGDWRPAGISTGQWRKVEGTGDHITITYMNALWQPVLVHDYDQSNVAGSLRSTRTEYDSRGRVSFQSYPSSDPLPGTTGTRTFYDALDRVVRVEQDSELDMLVTTTEYLPGLKTRVTNPRGQQTTTSFLAWDRPNYELPILSEQPEGKVIQIDRHPQLGWPLALTQRNAANTLSATRRYVYDGYAQLCKTIEPEIGATVTGYDAAGNPSWSAAGLTGGDYANPNDCSFVAANSSGRVTVRTYDSRNRLHQLLFPDGRGNQTWTYTPDGLPASITTYNGAGNTEPVVTAYTYNKRRLLTGESLTQYIDVTPWYTWAIGYAHNAYGNLHSQTYPTGLTVDYAPNPLGQATKAGNYASGAQYYPNGALKQFTYGNGIVHSMQQNARQLPSRVTSSGGVNDFTYNYDANGNITNIWDLVRGDNYSRWLSYDNLDRLTAAGSASFGGDAWHRMTYDALDNLKSWKLAGVKDYADYVYNSQNRLTSIRNTAGATVVGLAYDLQGNLQNKNGQLYDFDYGNRLRSVASKENYRYDGLGRRVQTTATDGKTTVWQYSQNGQMLFSSDWGGPDNQAQQIHENVYLAGSLIATIDHAWPSNAVLATKYQHTDALGSPVAVTNAAGQVTERMDYEPWGAIINNPTRSGIGFTGHVMDGGTGFTYMQQRYYDQSVGRFLSVDPVTAHEKPGQNFNRYWYAGNNTYKFFDPDGREMWVRSGSDEDLQEFLDQIELATGYPVQAKDAEDGLKTIEIAGQRDESKGTVQAAQSLLATINSNMRMYYDIVRSHPGVIGDSFFFDFYDLSDFSAFFSSSNQLGSALFAHVLEERLNDVSTQGGFLPAHEHAKNIEASIMGAVSRNDLSGRTPAGQPTFGFEYVDATGAVVSTFVFSFSQNGELQK